MKSFLEWMIYTWNYHIPTSIFLDIRPSQFVPCSHVFHFLHLWIFRDKPSSLRTPDVRFPERSLRLLGVLGQELTHHQGNHRDQERLRGPSADSCRDQGHIFGRTYTGRVCHDDGDVVLFKVAHEEVCPGPVGEDGHILTSMGFVLEGNSTRDAIVLVVWKRRESNRGCIYFRY